MHAILTKQPGDSSQLYLGEAPIPTIEDDELLVRIEATSVNRADILQRKGLYPPPAGSSPILGLEMAGVVVKLGEKCEGFSIGDRVFSILGGGGYAQYAAVQKDIALHIPESLSFKQAAGVAEVFLTAYQALFWLGSLRKNKSVLIHAGASGVGTAAIQLAKTQNCQIMTTAGSEKKVEYCEQLGASLGINYKKVDFEKTVLEYTKGYGADLILDFIGGPYLNKNLECIANDGHIVILGLLGGRIAENIDLGTLLTKRISIKGSTLRNRSNDYKAQLAKEFSEKTIKLLSDGTIFPVIDRVFPWEKVKDAHDRMEANLNTGKIILTVSHESEA